MGRETGLALLLRVRGGPGPERTLPLSRVIVVVVDSSPPRWRAVVLDGSRPKRFTAEVVILRGRLRTVRTGNSEEGIHT